MALKRLARTRFNSLVFFISTSLILFSCGKPSPDGIEIQYDQGRARGVLIPKSLVAGVPSDSIEQLVSVSLRNAPTRMLGSYENKRQLVFTPLIPFTPGLDYDVYVKDHKVASFAIPSPDPRVASVLTDVYPTQDTVPMNLLKMYLKFSKPMRSGEALNHIILTKSNGDTAKGVFLDLQQELWNEDQTTLTLWLDPGRIKRDLQPNKLLGNPLEQDETYTLRVDRNWKDQMGGELANARTRTFYVSVRDSLSPQPSTWRLSPPRAGTTEPVKIEFGESLDFSLTNSAIHVMSKGLDLPGSTATGSEEKSWSFIPSEPWAQGAYVIEIESRLEDLAGNNLNRPFDRDITTTANAKIADAISLPFTVK
jgi:hypothetical protein